MKDDKMVASMHQERPVEVSVYPNKLGPPELWKHHSVPKPSLEENRTIRNSVLNYNRNFDDLNEFDSEDITSCEDSDTGRKSICSKLQISEFCASQITHLDLGKLEVAKEEIFQTGCLPKWICNFHKLEFLRAPKLGIIIIEPWILELRNLRELHLEQNKISTWPYFLRELPSIEIVSLDGNPCLEVAFHKSPTLRSRFFNWNADSTEYKVVPPYIRGSEWPPAAGARLSSSANINHLGFYCGGIYTLSTKPNLSNDGLLTPLEPDPLFTRLHCRQASEASTSPISPYSFEYKDPYATSCQEFIMTTAQSIQSKKQTEIVREIFDDISILLNRDNFPKPSENKIKLPLVGTRQSSFNQLLESENEKLSHKEMVRYCRILVDEEHEYIDNLKLVYNEFLGAKIKSSTILEWLGIVFEGFVAMSRIHRKWVLPSLKSLLHASELSANAAVSGYTAELYGNQIKPKEKPEVPKDVIELLAFSLSHLQKAMCTYSGNIWRAEYLLDMESAATRLYEDSDLENYVKSQMTKLGNVGGHLGSTFVGYTPGSFSLDFVGRSYKVNVGSLGASLKLSTSLSNNSAASSSASLKSLSTTSTPASSRASSKDQQLKPAPSLSTWVEKQLQKSSPKLVCHPANFVYLPLIRLVRYERFFTSLYRTNNQFERVVRLFRSLRHSVAQLIEEMRMNARCNVLAKKFKTTAEYFKGYKWDAVVTVRSRSYFEHGILSRKTNDVIDADGNPVSFVKEAFLPSRMRILRLVCCEDYIHIWDDIFEHFIGKTKKSQLIAIPTNDPQHPLEIRLLFVEVKETCLIQVKDFKAKYHTHLSHSVEFMQACRHGDKYMV